MSDRTLYSWYKLMEECVSVDTRTDAEEYFSDVEREARKLKILCPDGNPFKAKDAMKEWDILYDKVTQDIDDLIFRYGDNNDDFPCVGLKYMGYDNELILGIYDLGNFEERFAWKFCTPVNNNIACLP